MTTTPEADIHFTATGEEDGKTLLFRSLRKIPEGSNPADYPYLVTIFWPYVAVDDGGMPDADTNEDQIEFEEAISHLDSKGTGHLMLVVTGNGSKEWNWYVADVNSWMEQLNTALSERAEFPIEIENCQQPDWSLYHDFISGVEGINQPIS
ncbi:hypothetical protein AB833_29540 [Chromatiales bacterium (ex Bugula neritina AB1)]|nr:hypothetical protein AB833_29540 [Chromatiales bacterium (ex Bugula neritina AB1)]